MLPCLPEHVGAARCPECESNHKEFGLLPEKLLTINDIPSLYDLNSIDGVIPIYQAHTTDASGTYMKAVPALVVITGTTVRVVKFNPQTEHSWITVRMETVDFPEILAEEMAQALRACVLLETEVDGLKVVHDDDLIPMDDADAQPLV